MRVGVVILPEHSWSDAKEIWREVETIGFDHAWTYDHLAWRSLQSQTWYSSIPTLAAASLVTRNIALGTLVASPNFRHPVPLAKDVMTVDDISGGRMVLGIGAGAPGLDEHIIGREPIPPGARGRRFREFVHVMDVLLRNQTTNHDGEYYRVNEAPMVPGCVQQPRVPFAIAATGALGIRLAARFAQIWVTNGDPGRFRELPEETSLALVARQREQLSEACEQVGRKFSEISTMVNGSVIGRAPTASITAFLEFARKCADVGFTDLTVHYPRSDGIFAGCRSEFVRLMTAAIPVVHTF